MTKRLFFDDAYLTRFSARITEQIMYENRFAIVLDQTAFYPTSGGQPFDQGVLGGKRVADVAVREQDGAIIHVLETSLANQSPEVVGEIDWDRRFDHMQQHTGQHVLSQAFLQVAQAETVGFHLGIESVTIDLSSHQGLSPAVMQEVEALTNQIVWQDRPVTTHVVSSVELNDWPLRKPSTVTDDIRIVQVEGFDWSACGGTHVARTGEVGLIKIIKWEKRGTETRIEFKCGQRALSDYAQKNNTVNQLAAGFNVGHWELAQVVERQTAEIKELRSHLRRAGRTLARHEADELRATAPSIAGVRLVVRNLTGESLVDMRELARQLVSEPGVAALLGVGDHMAQLCFARSADVDINMVSLVRDASEILGARGGGGRPDYAQGGGPLTDVRQLDAVLKRAVQRLGEQL